MELSERSLKNLEGVHADLVKVAHRAAELATKDGLEFQVISGVRTKIQQSKIVARGASMTMNSRHLTGDAFDFVPYIENEMCWKWPAYWPIVELIEQSAKELNIRVECGARWKKFPDGGHVQRPWK